MSALAPGLHDMAAERYHDLPALSASGAWTIDDGCLRKYWHDSPFNPEREPYHKPEFDFGTAAHLAVLEPGEFNGRVHIVEARKKDGTMAENYQSPAAREVRGQAYAAGKVPLFAHQIDQVMAFRAALLADPDAGMVFRDGKPEQTFIWRDPETGILCKARADWLRHKRDYIADLKAHASANPRKFPGTAWSLGYLARAAWYLDGFELATGERIGEYKFAAVERDPPHCCAVFFATDRALEFGRAVNHRALALLGQAMKAGNRPGYSNPAKQRKDGAFPLDAPPWAEFQIQERHEAGEFSVRKPSAAEIRLALEAQAPL